MAGAIELATIKAPVVADQKQFKQGMAEVKKTGKQVANEIEKEFQNSSKKLATSWDNASKKIQKSLKTTEQEAKELTKAAENIYKEGFGKSVNDVVKSLSQTKRALGDIDSAELETATKRAMELRDTMGVKMSKTLKMAKQEMDQYGSTAEQAFDRVEKRLETTEAAWGKLGSKGEKLTTIGSAMTAGLTVPIVGLGVAALKAAGDVETANARIASSLGLTQEQSAVTKQAMEQIFSDGYGETWDDVADSIIQVKQQLGDIPDDQIVKVTENALILRDTLGQDMGESLRGINSLMVNFGMDADSAMDLYVTGVQRGLDKTGELGDNLAEYGQLWSQAGFSAEQMFAVLENGLKSGAYNLDKVNDFVKEFTISLTDGRIADNLDKFSGSTQGIFKEFQKGEKTAQDVFKSVINDLENTTNQQDKLTLASTVWSALGEDNAMKIIESLNDVNDSYDDTADAMEKVKAQQEETFGSRSKALFRDAQTALLPIGEALLDIAERYMPKVEKAVDAFSDTLSSMSDEDIERVLKIGGFIAIAGPTVVAIGKVTKGISDIGGSLKLASGLLGGGATSLGTFGGAASAAAGSSGVGAMTTALGAGGLAGALPLIVGAGGLLAVGYGAWKLFGEEAWNSAQRVQEWGSDVGETTDEALSKIQENTQEATGQFDLMEEGFSVNTENMVGNFQRIGQTIEDELTQQINAFKESLDLLPEEVQGAAEEIINSGVEKREKALAIVQENNNRILEIKKQYVDQDGEITIQGAKMIQDLMKQSTQEYLNITIEDADARREVMDALNGDVENASQQQAESWLKSLGKQRQETKSSYTQQLEDYKSYLDKQGILNTEEGQQLVALFEKARDQSTQSIDAQMAIIAEKYPELADKIFLANGQLISEMGQAGEAAKKSNQDIIKNAQDLSNQLAANAKKNANILAWTADETTKAGQIWNSLELIDKEGNIKTNANEIVTEATKDAQTWNDLKLLVHDADLDSNAKDVIGEAAIANGWWDGMAWGDKAAILQDEFSITMYKALEDSGKWEQMSFEEKKAFLYSNTPEVMAETMLKLGLWDEYQPEIKDLDADNYDLLNALSFSETALNSYIAVEPGVKELLANDPATLTYEQSTKALQFYDSLDPELKTLLGQNTNVLDIINAAQRKIDNYDRNYNPGPKHLNATADTSAVDYMQQEINKIPDYIEKRVAVIYEGRTTGQAAIQAATGHKGLPKDQTVMVNDQKGPLYEELITPPDGAPFIIPKQRDVILPLKKGTRIDKAVDTRSILNSIPRFAGGVGNQLPYDGYNASFKQTDATVSLKQPDGGTNAMIDLLSELLTKENTIVLELDGREAATGLWRYIDALNTRKIRTAERAQGRRG